MRFGKNSPQWNISYSWYLEPFASPCCKSVPLCTAVPDAPKHYSCCDSASRCVKFWWGVPICDTPKVCVSLSNAFKVMHWGVSVVVKVKSIMQLSTTTQTTQYVHIHRNLKRKSFSGTLSSLGWSQAHNFFLYPSRSVFFSLCCMSS